MAMMSYLPGNKTRFDATDARIRPAATGNLSRTPDGGIVKNLHIRTSWQITSSHRG